MASSDDIRSIREAQRNDPSLTFSQAKKQLGAPKDFAAENVTKLFAEIAALKQKLAGVEVELHGMRIIGPEFSGQGPRNISFKLPQVPNGIETITINNDTPELVTITGGVSGNVITLDFNWAATTDCPEE